MVDFYVLFKIEIIVDDIFSFIVKFYGCFLLEDYLIYMKYCCFMRNIIISCLVDEFEFYVICCGVELNDFDCSMLLYYVIFIYIDFDVLEIE